MSGAASLLTQRPQPSAVLCLPTSTRSSIAYLHSTRPRAPPPTACIEQLDRFHHARSARSRYPGSHRCLAPRAALRLGRGSPLRYHLVRSPPAAQEPRHRPGHACPPPRRPQGPGPHFPEPLQPPWRRPQERHEVRRLVQDQGDCPERPRLGALSSPMAGLLPSAHLLMAMANRLFPKSRLPVCAVVVVPVSPRV